MNSKVWGWHSNDLRNDVPADYPDDFIAPPRAAYVCCCFVMRTAHRDHGKSAEPRRCRAKARAGALTCQSHRKHEDAAKAWSVLASSASGPASTHTVGDALP